MAVCHHFAVFDIYTLVLHQAWALGADRSVLVWLNGGERDSSKPNPAIAQPADHGNGRRRHRPRRRLG
uniref:Uncharacterized protein n=1 Tax=Anopheles coluzzii TaxID=1518534 RepID=A0A8W7Q3J2_ANOCL